MLPRDTEGRPKQVSDHREGDTAALQHRIEVEDAARDIKAKYDAVNGPVLLGKCQAGELATPDGVGRYNHYERGSIYWTPETGAKDEYAVTGGRESEFQKGLLTLNTATHTVTVRMK